MGTILSNLGFHRFWHKILKIPQIRKKFLLDVSICAKCVVYNFEQPRFSWVYPKIFKIPPKSKKVTSGYPNMCKLCCVQLWATYVFLGFDRDRQKILLDRRETYTKICFRQFWVTLVLSPDLKMSSVLANSLKSKKILSDRSKICIKIFF